MTFKKERLFHGEDEEGDFKTEVFGYWKGDVAIVTEIKREQIIKENIFEKDFPSFKEITFFVRTNDKQLFSERNNLNPVIPEDVVKNYLQRHCRDNQRIEEAIHKAVIGVYFKGYDVNSEKALVEMQKYFLGELGL